jgi:RES domain-containing protein
VIRTRLDNLSAYRMHVPKWAAMPLSGEGAAQHGGRANRPGIAAIYLALDIETAVKEYQQVSSLATNDAIAVFDPGGTLPKNQESWV